MLWHEEAGLQEDYNKTSNKNTEIIRVFNKL